MHCKKIKGRRVRTGLTEAGRRRNSSGEPCTRTLTNARDLAITREEMIYERGTRQVVCSSPPQDEVTNVAIGSKAKELEEATLTSIDNISLRSENCSVNVQTR